MTPSERSRSLVRERKKTHGDWAVQSSLARTLKEAMRDSANWKNLSPSQAEALDMIQTKVSRILSGDPSESDHWNDIAGYAVLAGSSKP